jgi:hypothetical protein
MLTSLEIQNFKAFRHLKIERLAKVNLFVGEGNSGKTSVLEALQLLPHQGEAQNHLESWFRNSVQMGRGEEWLRWLSRNLDSSRPIQVTATRPSELRPLNVVVDKATSPMSPEQVGIISVGGLLVSWNIAPSKTRLLPSISHTPTRSREPTELAKAFDKWTLRDGDEERFVKFAQSVDPRIKSLRAKEHTGIRKLYASIGLPEVIPLPLLGEGLNRLIEIYGAIIGEGANIVLIDEIENGLHWKALPKVWQGIKAVVDAEVVQIFATTHSIECIEAASEVFKGPPNDFAVHRLERRDDGDIHCVTMGEVELGRMLERGWEVR